MTQRDEFKVQSDAKYEESVYFDKAVRNLKIIGASIAFAYVVIFAGGVWVANVQGSITNLKENVAQAKVVADQAAKTLEIQDRANQTIFAERKNMIEGLEKRIGVLEGYVPLIQEVGFMKDHGISNRAAFFEKHGYPAPISPGETAAEPKGK